LALQRIKEAEASFRMALERDPYGTNALYNLGLMLLRSGGADRVDEAERLLARYVRVMPSDAAVWAHLARAREMLGDAPGAREARRRAERRR
jgi:predicted Zn-dependent protease